MEYYNKILCVTYAELTGGSDAVIKAATLLKNVSRGNIVSVHRGGGEGGQALYAWSSIPQKYKERYMEWKSHSTLTPLGKQNCSLWP